MKVRKSLQGLSVLLLLLSYDAIFFLPILSVGLSWILLALTLTVGVSVLLLALTLIGGLYQRDQGYLLSKNMSLLLKKSIFFQLISFSLASVLHLVIVFLPVVTGGLLTVTLILIGLLGASTLLYMVYGAFEVVFPYKQPLSHKSDGVEQESEVKTKKVIEGLKKLKAKIKGVNFKFKNFKADAEQKSEASEVMKITESSEFRDVEKNTDDDEITEISEIKVVEIIEPVEFKHLDCAWENLSRLEDNDRTAQLNVLKRCDVGALLKGHRREILGQLFDQICRNIIPQMLKYLNCQDFKEQILKFSPFFQEYSQETKDFCHHFKSFLDCINKHQNRRNILLKKGDWEEGLKLFFAIEEVGPVIQDKIGRGDNSVDHIVDFLSIIGKNDSQMQVSLLSEITRLNLWDQTGCLSILSSLSNEAGLYFLETCSILDKIDRMDELQAVLKQFSRSRISQEKVLDLFGNGRLLNLVDSAEAMIALMDSLCGRLQLKILEMLNKNNKINPWIENSHDQTASLRILSSLSNEAGLYFLETYSILGKINHMDKLQAVLKKFSRDKTSQESVLELFNKDRFFEFVDRVNSLEAVITLMGSLHRELQKEIFNRLNQNNKVDSWIENPHHFRLLMQVLGPFRNDLFHKMKEKLLNFNMKNDGLLHILCFLKKDDRSSFLEALRAKGRFDWIKSFKDLSFVVALDGDWLKTIMIWWREDENGCRSLLEDAKKDLASWDHNPTSNSRPALLLLMLYQLYDWRLSSEVEWLVEQINWNQICPNRPEKPIQIIVPQEYGDFSFTDRFSVKSLQPDLWHTIQEAWDRRKLEEDQCQSNSLRC